MSLNSAKRAQLEELCHKFRVDLIETLYAIQTGHPGGSLSVCEILTVLYFHKMNIKASDPTWPERDRLVLGKGHAAPMLYRVLSEKGFFPVEEMKTLRQIDSILQGHPCSLTTPGVELSSGPLGLGLSAALGMALGLKLSNVDATVYAILGDGEINEGTVWEACMSAAKYKADNLITILDYNGVQLDGTNDEIMPLGDVRGKFEVFGFEVFECDGHDVSELNDVIDKAKQVKDKPTMIIAHTIKGKGISFMEGESAWHGKPISQEEYELAMEELGVATSV